MIFQLQNYNFISPVAGGWRHYASANCFSFHKTHYYAFGGYERLSAVMDSSMQRAIGR